MLISRRLLFAAAVAGFVACHTPPTAAKPAVDPWQACALVPGAPSLRGLSAVDATTAWVSGAKGTIARTTDGGASWQRVAPPGCDACDFRDVEAFDANTAVAMVAGQPARVYRTTDGGGSWQLVLADARPQAFFDGIAFAGQVGMLFGDPIDGAFCVWTTRDGGASWTPVPRDSLPAPLPGEAAFAASGTSVAVSGAAGHETFWIATGGGARARVLRGDANGWRAIDVPLRAGKASQGGFGLAVHGERIALVGGDYEAPREVAGTGAYSEDGGRSWRAVEGGVGGFRSAVTWIGDDALLAVGSHGASLLTGPAWACAPLGEQGFHCVARAGDDSLWVAGDGRVAKWKAPAWRLRLAHLFGDHMVLPAASEVVVRGFADAGAHVHITTSWGAEAAAVARNDGRFACPIRTPAARGGPHTLAVACELQRITLRDVLVGDVWLASGQSNMEMALGKHDWSNGVRDHEREEAAATLPTLRVFTAKQTAREQPADDVDGEWVVCSPQTAATFSATGFLFARELVAAGKGPIGLVVSSWGGTVCEAWASEPGLATFPEFASALAQQRAASVGSAEQRLAAFWRALDALAQGAAIDVAVPEKWSGGALRDFDGAVAYERTVDVPAALRGKRCWLELGAIDDMDTVWWNDRRVGGQETDGNWNRPRRYEVVPDGERATLRIRVVDTGGEGGFAAKPEQLQLVADDGSARVPLAGTWQRRVLGKLADLPPWPRGDEPNRPAVLWNGMIAPLLPFPFTGAIWYQGEANRGRAEQYSRLFPAMIADWRRAIGRVIPFYFVQIAPYGYGGDRGETAALRLAQAAALQLPQTGMVVTLDCGDAKDIHPIDKQPVGKRLAALALARHYGGGGPCEGPTLTTVTRRGAEVVLRFAHGDGGLQLANDGAGFEVAGDDGAFVAATARCDGDAVVLTSPIPTPTQLRYAWAAVPGWSLRNGAGFPAPPFRAAIR